MDSVGNGVAPGDAVVGMVGTFDVENYGDLLFPLIADASLRRRDAQIRVRPFSVNGKSASEWPYALASVDALIDALPQLSALLVGGGQIVRFDGKYPAPTPAGVDLPFAYWLTPAVLAALVGKPVIWNAVGASLRWPHTEWHEALLRDVLSASAFIGVRDEVSREALAAVAPAADLQLLPDTAFGLSRVWPLAEESAAYTDWRRSIGLDGRYLVVQASAAMGQWRGEIERQARAMDAAIVLLPICWCHGDRAEAVPTLTGRVRPSRAWLDPKLTSEILGRAELVVASSLHACISALSYGVPVGRVPIYWGPSKFDRLDAFASVARIDRPASLDRVVARGRHIEPMAVACADELERYWDMVCRTVRQPSIEHRDRATSTMLRWAARAAGGRQVETPADRARIWLRDVVSRQLVEERMMLRRWLSTGFGRRGAAGRVGDVQPTRSLNGRTPVLNLPHLARQTMETDPFRWAFIDRLFSETDAVALSSTFPHDKFKAVKGHDGEKDYEYMSRSLIHMGAGQPTFGDGLSQAWRTLAEDLLAAEYRSALSQLTGCDLVTAPMEVNVVHYGPGAWLGPHLDLKEKIVTHVLYFNDAWDPQLGGCLNILRSPNPGDTHATIPPVVGNSVLLVRSNRSWHSVSRVAAHCQTSRRSVNVIFHLPGSVSTMWPPGRTPALQDLQI